MEIPTDPILQMQLLQALTLSMRGDTVMEIVDNAPEIAPPNMVLLFFSCSNAQFRTLLSGPLNVA